MRTIVALTCVFSLAYPNLLLAGLPDAPPSQLGFDPDRLARIDAAVERAVTAGRVPGALVMVTRHGNIALAKAYGKRAVEPNSEEMTRDTIFDMASLTKPMATATSILILLEQGKLRLSDRLGRLLPEFINHGKGAITVDQLLRHRSGLIADNPLGDYADGPEKAWERLAALDMVSQPGEKFLYSDVNFLILGRIVEKLSGEPLDVFARTNIFEPLGMVDTAFRPDGVEPVGGNISRIAPTERDGRTMLRGRVHDPRSRALGGVAGHAGLFSTADDVALFAQMMLNGGLGANGKRVLSPLAVRVMIDAADTPAHERRGLGWDVDTTFSAPRGNLFGTRSFGHTGFTGTTIWIDPETDCCVILLTSRLHPDGKAPAPTALRAEVATLAAAAIRDASTQPEKPPTSSAPARTTAGLELAGGLHPVECGIDVLEKEGFKSLRGKRVALVTNHTGRTVDGCSTIDVLFHAPDVTLVALFSPEHGIRGKVDTQVADSKDESTGLPIFSLYGNSHKPSAENLRNVDILVYDIQDIGARFYTYISTLGLVLEAAAEQKIPLVVLDRPNPVGGVEIDGPVRDQEFASFVAYHALPVRHGLTVGELAQLFNGERKIGAELVVVPCRGWRRADLFDRTGLLWVNPSPNMRSLTEAILYPGVALLEATNFATGRGTDTPFERVGAPWIDARKFSEALNAQQLPGVRFVPIRFTPAERQYAGQECGGVQILFTDWGAANPLDIGLALALTLRAQYRDQWKPEGLQRLLTDKPTYEAILDGKDIAAIRTLWKGELEEYRKVRAKYLLYK
jgi:uncharacterized protein YbbC (DUF1343 family)/CubicO group peptidase (beta-lactamase class C family)